MNTNFEVDLIMELRRIADALEGIGETLDVIDMIAQTEGLA